MKKRTQKTIISLSLIFSMCITLFAGRMNVRAAENLSINYLFSNEMAGFAEGTISLNSNSDGEYTLYFADDDKALDGYYEIGNVQVVNGVGSYEFLKNIALPADATKVIAYKSNSIPSVKTVSRADAVYDIPKAKQNPYSSADKTLSFEALSDTQLDYQSNVFYTVAEKHFAMALEDAANRNVDFITTSGDCINNYEDGTSKEWQCFQKIIAQSSYTGYIYEGNGNHSMKSDIQYGLQAFIAATGLSNDKELLGTKPYYEVTAKNGDHFIFVALEGSSAVGNIDEFSEEQMDWFEGLLQSYYGDGHKIFVFEHAFFHGWGPGDSKTEHYYAAGLRTSSQFPGNQRFRNLIDTYKEVFLYTGHSHFDFEYNWNYDNENGQTANLFHIPATACTTHVVNGKIDYTMHENDSQCYIVDVYPDMVISNGLNIVDNCIYPAYSYVVSTANYTGEIETPEVEDPGEYIESNVKVDVQVVDNTSGQYLVSSGAVLYLYNNDSGNYYPVDSTSLIAEIPENALKLTLYRCNGEWGVGNKSDANCPGYFNVFGPYERTSEQNIFVVASSSNASKNYWKTGEIDYSYGQEEEPEEPEVEEVTTIYWAIPNSLVSDSVTYKIYLNGMDGSFTGYGDYNFIETAGSYGDGYKIYSFVLDAEKTSAIKQSGGLSRIQIKGKNTSNVQVCFFQFGDKTGKICDLSDIDGKIAVLTDQTWSLDQKGNTVKGRNVSSDFVNLLTVANADYAANDKVLPTDMVTIIDNTSSHYIFGSGAKVFLYDVNNDEHYEISVDESGLKGTVNIPKNTSNIIIYRCNGEWAVGGSDVTKNDNGIRYWNKWEPGLRGEGWDELTLGGGTGSDTAWRITTPLYNDTTEFFLKGYFDGKDYTGNKYKIDSNGEVSAEFLADSYVYIETSENVQYWTNGWLGTSVSSGEFVPVQTLSNPDKLFVPAGKIKFKLIKNENGSLTLKYDILHVDVDKSELIIKSDSEIDAREIPDVSTMDKLIDVVEKILTEDYRYASFESYADLKRIYFGYLDSKGMTDVYQVLLDAYNSFNEMKEVNNIVTVYFCNDIPWTSVKTFINDSDSNVQINSLETAQGISKIKTLNCGVKIYEVTVNQSQFDKITFTNGDGLQTVELDVPINNHTGFYFTDSDLSAQYLEPNRFIYSYDEPAVLFANKTLLENNQNIIDDVNGDKENETGDVLTGEDNFNVLYCIYIAMALTIVAFVLLSKSKKIIEK